ncbi:hypothetical protein G9A89_004385 [Geosiphon pyriformis]|nr:hypothetical protein G9A89_004385 [Geosiphon pyriformis]
MDETMPCRTHTQTYVLKQPLKVPLFATMNNDDDNSVLSPPKINGSNQLPSSKSHVLKSHSFGPVKLFALNVNLSAVSDRTNTSTSSKFSGIIHSTFTSESSLIKAKEMAVCKKIVVNGDLIKANIHLNWEVIVKKIPVDLPKLAVESVFSKFGRVVSIKMQLIGLWQKALIEFESSEVASLVVFKWSVLMRKGLVCVALAVGDKQMWVLRDQHWALLYTLLVSTTAHDFSGLLNLYSGKTCVIGCNLVTGVCSVGENFGSHGKRVVTNLDRVHLASIYKKKQAPVTRPVSFGSRTWALVVGAPSVHSFSGDGSIFGSKKVGKPLSSVANDLEECLVNIESSLISLVGQISELAKRLDLFMLVVPQPSPGCQLLVTLLL